MVGQIRAETHPGSRPRRHRSAMPEPKRLSRPAVDHAVFPKPVVVRDGGARAVPVVLLFRAGPGLAADRHEAREAVMCFVHSGSAEGGSLIQRTVLDAAAATAFFTLAAGGGAAGGGAAGGSAARGGVN